jgi:hypothetical protein
MAIATRGPRRGFRMLVLGVLLVGGLALLGGARADEARAHGNCDNQKTAPAKVSGVIKGTNRYVCDYQHAEVHGCVSLEMETTGGWVALSDPNCKPPNTSTTQSKQVGATTECVSGNYRTVGQGHAVNLAGDTVHNGRDTSVPKPITCSMSDLLNTQGVFETIGTRTP